MSGHAARAQRAATRVQTYWMAMGRMLLEGDFSIGMRRPSRSAGRWGKRPLTIALTSWRREDRAAAPESATAARSPARGAPFFALLQVAEDRLEVGHVHLERGCIHFWQGGGGSSAGCRS
jgi:hypothetical protein